MKKTVLITTRAVSLGQTQEIRDCLDQRLVTYLEEMGYLPFLMPNFEFEARIEEFVDAINPSLIVLSGGNNISPSLYGSTRTDVQDISLRRDMAEKKLLKLAIQRKIKVLGICRGMQMINVYFGGSLCQIKSEIGSSINHVAVTHKISMKKIDFMPDSKDGLEVAVNSYHDYGFTVANIGQGLIPLAETEDRVVEMIKHQDFPILGMMWHPERPLGDKDFERGLLKNFFTV